MITILNYGLGNLFSIKNMLKRVGFDCIITANIEEVERATKIILPGVGHFDYGMKKLREAIFFETLQRKAMDEKTPVLGICMGAQMLLEKSEEGTENGLGWIKGVCKKFDILKMNEPLTIPNMGWCDVNYVKESPLNVNINKIPRYYFVHSFHINCTNPNDVLATTEYGYTYTAAVNKENIYGVQFHPEKSHKFGMAVLENFAQL
ncbi:MAG: imidazole glycerol phosphate synthase subunit HisH [Bacteroidia bacterium]|nr:imidazole glycerol phosphate synthase subunit HisH [Bacteroidia bacterium]